MDLLTATQEVERLTREINHHNHLFFLEGRSEISDYDFDQLVKALEGLEAQYPQLKKADSPTQKVGEAPSKNFLTRPHRYPMHSLSNTYQAEEVQQFADRIQKLLPQQPIDFFAELKLDGIAVSLTYQRGKFVRLLTRGDGTQGDDITLNSRLIQGIPLELVSPSLPEEIHIRGEVFMPHADFEKVNRYYEKEGRAPLANPRNGTAGMLRTKKVDPALFAMRPLKLGTYGMVGENLEVTTQQAALAQARAWGFYVPDTSQYCPTIQQVMDYITHWEEHRASLPWDIDGVVMKVNAFAQQKILGQTAKSPRWAVAFKYKPLAVQTQLEGVVYQVGRTGAVVPVAELCAVQLAGTTVKRATLHNAGELQRLGLHEGDTVSVEKGGDIIPKITGVDLSQRVQGSRPYVFTTQCPSCGSALQQEEGEAHFYCPNRKACKAQLKNTLNHFIQRKAMDLTTIGPQTIDLLFEADLIRRPADLYHLRYEDVAHLEGFQEKSTKNFFQALEVSKQVPFARVLFALGIRHVGATVAKKLSTYFKSLSRLQAATLEELTALREVGDKIAASLIAYFADPENVAHMEKLAAAGLSLEIEESAAPISQVLQGKKFCVSGTFEGLSRDDMYDYIQQRGGQIVGSVSKKLDFLVTGHAAGPSKLKKADSLGIPQIDWAQLRTMSQD